MLAVGDFVEALIPLYIMGVIGFLATRYKILKNGSNQVMTQLMLYITLPALILFSLDTTISKNIVIDFLWLLLMSCFILTVFIVVAAYLRRQAALPGRQKSVYESLIIFGNQGFIGFAVSYILLGEQGVLYVTLFNILYFILIWTYGIYLFIKDTEKIRWHTLFLNPGILSTLLGLCMLLLPFTWPVFALDVFRQVGKMTIPLSMLLIGGLLANLSLTDFIHFIKNKYLWIASTLKLFLIPLTLFIFLLFPVPFPVVMIAVLTSAMPSASTISIYAEKFGGDSSFASFGVILSTLLCVITIPLLYSFLYWVHHLTS